MKYLITIIFVIAGFKAFSSNNCQPDTNENGNIAIVATPDLAEFFTQANAFLTKYVRAGKVDYSGIKSDPVKLNELYAAIGSADLSSADKNTKTAFYLNAYNLIVIYSVVQNLPIAKPLDVNGFFDSKKHTVAGINVTLNELENSKLRPDPRVHFSLVCAAKGCPKIAAEAFMPATVENQMNALTKKAMNDGTFIQVNNETKVVKISKIFDWYSADFLSKNASTIAFINKYRTTAIPESYRIEYYEYDWSLNGK